MTKRERYVAAHQLLLDKMAEIDSFEPADWRVKKEFDNHIDFETESFFGHNPSRVLESYDNTAYQVMLRDYRNEQYENCKDPDYIRLKDELEDLKQEDSEAFADLEEEEETDGEE